MSCFAASANEFYIFEQCTYIVFILLYEKAETAAKLSKQSRNKRRSNRFYSDLCEVRAYLRHEPSVRKTISWSVTVYLTKVCPVNAI